jgi:hypothetical protein
MQQAPAVGQTPLMRPRVDEAKNRRNAADSRRFNSRCCTQGSRRDMTPQQDSLSGVIICPAEKEGQRLTAKPGKLGPTRLRGRSPLLEVASTLGHRPCRLHPCFCSGVNSFTTTNRSITHRVRRDVNGGVMRQGYRAKTMACTRLVRSAPPGREDSIGVLSPDGAALCPGLFPIRPSGTRGCAGLAGRQR